MQNKKIKLLFALLMLSVPLISHGASLYNPLGADVNSLPKLINNAIKGILGLVGAISLIMIVIGGITWMTSAGNADRVRRGRDTLVWAIMGLIAVFLSYAIISFVFTALIRGES
jgi:hypothetical protein